MDENNNIIENGIRLQDGNVIQGYPKQDGTEETTAETPMLDKTGEYFSIRKKPNKPQPTDEEELALRKLFTDNAFLILANRKRILSDSRMLLTPVPVRNGLAYSGAFATATLGVYIEWWLNAPYSVLFSEDDTMSLIWFVSGSPLSGSNRCAKVYEDGRIEEDRVPFFIKLWPKFGDILADYREPKKLYQAYTLPEVIDILQRETTTEDYERSIKEFHHQAQVNLLNAQLQDLEEKYKHQNAECERYQKEWHFALFQLKQDEIFSFYKEYILRREKLQKRREELDRVNSELKEKLRKGELSNKEYQPLLTANKKETEQLKWSLDSFANDHISMLIPKLTEGHTYLSYSILDSVLSEIAEFVESENPKCKH